MNNSSIKLYPHVRLLSIHTRNTFCKAQRHTAYMITLAGNMIALVYHINRYMYSHELIPGRHECYDSCRQVSCSYTLRIFLQLQRWLRHPFVQPHEVISLQACGIGGRESNSGTVQMHPSHFGHWRKIRIQGMCLVPDTCLIV